MKPFNFTLIALLTLIICNNVIARQEINIVGSSTVYPFTAIVSEEFGERTKFKTPRVESTGTGGGMKLFCEGNGINTPDIVNASRPIKKSEVELCKKNGVDNVFELKIGYDGIALATGITGPSFNLTLRHIYLALTKLVPNKDGLLVPNPYKYWSEIDPKLPKDIIAFYGPPPTSGTRDAFVEIAMVNGAKTMPILQQLNKVKTNTQLQKIMKTMGLSTAILGDKKDDSVSNQVKYLFKLLSQSLREDGVYIELGENDNLVIQKLRINTHYIGIFGFSFLEENLDFVKPLTVEGFHLTIENIASKQYPIARDLFLYVKMQHIKFVPGIKQFLNEYTSESAWSEDGYLVDFGLIPLELAERKAIKSKLQKALKE